MDSILLLSLATTFSCTGPGAITPAQGCAASTCTSWVILEADFLGGSRLSKLISNFWCLWQILWQILATSSYEKRLSFKTIHIERNFSNVMRTNLDDNLCMFNGGLTNICWPTESKRNVFWILRSIYRNCLTENNNLIEFFCWPGKQPWH